MKKKQNSGQAIMELLVLMLSFSICFLGLLLIMGISISNISVFNDAKFEADNRAQFANYGADGDSISHWVYTLFELTGQRIPFLPFDKPSSSLYDDFTEFSEQLKDPQYSEPKQEEPYEFNDYSKVDLKIADNFPMSMPFNYCEAANLLLGQTKKFEKDERVFTISDRKYFDRKKTYEAFKIILGTDLTKDFNLENNRSNAVYMPAMTVLDEF